MMILLRLFCLILPLVLSGRALAIGLGPALAPEQAMVADTLPPGPDAPWQAYAGTASGSDAAFWIRMQVDIVAAPGEMAVNPLALSVRLNGAYDFYWDGQLVGSTWAQGASAHQYNRAFLPVSGLAPGSHMLMMRVWTPGLDAGDPLALRIVPAAVNAGFFGVHPTVISTFFIAAIALLVAAYMAFQAHMGGGYAAMLAALLCFAIAALVLVEEGRFLFSYPYRYQAWLDRLLPVFAVAVFLLVPGLTIGRLALPNRRWWYAGILPMLLLALPQSVPVDYDVRALGFVGFYLLLACGVAWRHGDRTARALFIGVLLALLALAIDSTEKHLFLIVLMLWLAAGPILEMRRRTREAHRLELMSARLKADLIKRNIQPHFLMNSLTALMEWVETEPEKAVDFIDGLADEFRTLSRFADSASVALGEEIALCRAHLRLMALRLDGQFMFEADGTEDNIQVPPALFHTLLENAFSHNAYAGQHVQFRLTCITDGGARTYRFAAPVSGRQKVDIGTGTGTRYILARLEEFCGKSFDFKGEQVGSDWVTTIRIEPKTIGRA